MFDKKEIERINTIYLAEPIYEKGDSEQFLEVNIYDKFILDCHLTGNPLPFISWFFNG